MTQNEVTASYLKALGHPSRLTIARELLKGKMCVNETSACLKIAQANASQHLNILRINGIVESSRDGNLRYYSLKEPQKIQRILEVLETETA